MATIFRQHRIKYRNVSVVEFISEILNHRADPANPRLVFTTQLSIHQLNQQSLNDFDYIGFYLNFTQCYILHSFFGKRFADAVLNSLRHPNNFSSFSVVALV